MNKEQVSGKYQQLKGEIKKTWGKLTDDDIAYVDGQKDKLFGKIKETYGIGKEEAEKKLNELEKNCGSCSSNEAA